MPKKRLLGIIATGLTEVNGSGEDSQTESRGSLTRSR